MSAHSIAFEPHGRRSGYVISACIDTAILYTMNHLLEWGVPLVTPEFSDVLWAVNLSLITAIIINMTFVAYDAASWRWLGQAAMDATATLSAYALYLVFPFDLPSTWISSIFSLLLLLLTISLAISSVVHVSRGLSEFVD